MCSADAPALLEAAARSASIQLEQIEVLFTALELGPRQTSLRQVLRWFTDNTVYNPETQRRDECIYHAADVARSIWIDCGLALQSCASVAYWRARIVRTENRSHARGWAKLPPRAWIDWRAVVSRCGGRVSDRGAVRGGPTVAPPEAAGRPGAIPAGLPTLEDSFPRVPSRPHLDPPVAADCTPAAAKPLMPRLGALVQVRRKSTPRARLPRQHIFPPTNGGPVRVFPLPTPRRNQVMLPTGALVQVSLQTGFENQGCYQRGP